MTRFRNNLRRASSVLIVVSLALLLAQFAPMSAQNAGEQGPGTPLPSPPTNIPGVVCTGDFIKIGVNNLGTLGVGEAGVDPGTGFQFPIGGAYESLAIWFWGHGFKLAYRLPTGDKMSLWQPYHGYPPPAWNNITVIRSASAGLIKNTAAKCEIKVAWRTTDWNLLVTRHWMFEKAYPSVSVVTTVTNIGVKTITDVVWVEYVDWDINQVTSNDWINDAHGAYASYKNPALEDRTVIMGVTGYGIPSNGEVPEVFFVDLYAWDDVIYPFRGPGSFFMQSPMQRSFTYDLNVGLYYEVSEYLEPNEAVAFKTVFEAAWGELPGYSVGYSGTGIFTSVVSSTVCELPTSALRRV